jgi:Holliday junction resolvase RusA-like endonuclease
MSLAVDIVRGVDFVAYGNPLPAGSKIAGVAANGRRFVRDDNPNTREWKRTVAQAAGAAMNGVGLLDGPLDLAIRIVRPRPASHFGKHGLRPSAPKYPTTRPDVTKLVRAIEDAMLGVVFRDDSQCVRIASTKEYGEPARVEVSVRRM